MLFSRGDLVTNEQGTGCPWHQWLVVLSFSPLHKPGVKRGFHISCPLEEVHTHPWCTKVTLKTSSETSAANSFQGRRYLTSYTNICPLLMNTTNSASRCLAWNGSSRANAAGRASSSHWMACALLTCTAYTGAKSGFITGYSVVGSSRKTQL
jgi:hypothetical protein